MQIAERRDARRLAVAVAAAILVHIGLIVAIPFLTSLDTAPLPDYGPIVVWLDEPAASFEPPAPKPVPAVKAAPAVSPTPAPPAKTVPVAPTTATAAPAASTTARAPGASSFRQAGATTGTSSGAASASIVLGPPPVTLPAVGSTAPGSGEQRSGEAVTLAGAHATASSGSLDPRKLDSSLTAAAGSSAAAASGGGTAARAPAGAGIAWVNPGAAKGRDPRSNPQVELPDSVKERDLLPPEVTVFITVDADGVVSSVSMAKTSSIIEVDEACIAAVRRVRFPAAPGAAPISGWWTFRIKR